MQLQAGERVGEFLKKKLEENKLKRIDFSKKSGISNSTIYNTYNNKQTNVSFKTVLTLANYFNCSLDEVFGRDKFTDPYHKTYNKITSIEAMNKIKNFIRIKFEESDKNLPRFSKNCGLEEGAIRGFITDDSRHQNIYCNNILAIADHFSISMDELVGRSNIQSKTTSKSNNVKAELTDRAHIQKEVAQKFSAKDAAILNDIQQEIKEFHNEIKQKINSLNRVKTKVKDNSQSR